MRDDDDEFYDWDSDDYGDSKKSRDEAREMLSRWKEEDRKEENVFHAKATEITLLELHIHELVEDEIKKSSFSAAAADLEAQEILQRVMRR